jgi:hypothetical protein
MYNFQSEFFSELKNIFKEFIVHGIFILPILAPGVSDNETSSDVTNRAMERALGRSED